MLGTFSEGIQEHGITESVSNNEIISLVPNPFVFQCKVIKLSLLIFINVKFLIAFLLFLELSRYSRRFFSVGH
jgi:hypothetical protein